MFHARRSSQPLKKLKSWPNGWKSPCSPSSIEISSKGPGVTSSSKILGNLTEPGQTLAFCGDTDVVGVPGGRIFFVFVGVFGCIKSVTASPNRLRNESGITYMWATEDDLYGS